MMGVRPRSVLATAVPVIVRRLADGTVIALFPADPAPHGWTYQHAECCAAYTSAAGHHGVNVRHVLATSCSVTTEEAAPIVAELDGRGGRHPWPGTPGDGYFLALYRREGGWMVRERILKARAAYWGGGSPPVQCVAFGRAPGTVPEEGVTA